MKAKLLFIAGLALVTTACNSIPGPAIIPEAIFDNHDKAVITSFSNQKELTASTLYGNSKAVKTMTEDTGHTTGEVFTLVTWYEQPNPYWYGSMINSDIKTIEEVTITKLANDHLAAGYQILQGDRQISKLYNLKKQERIDFILSQHAMVFPSLAEYKL
ncbi:hypothetical protein HDF26_002905 [Pedobacter cryoconitis]|uniref:Uncharacterized protein n=1 Tax=Pedobacter cryoconitis TaxID=188932 RepID=A0A7W8ZI54_9SPHI|nr:hypothetical protein [Pedobacter cryoconitis]MBB5634427.1 hypothetical protein [Pedobacter cryoconitis]MBB6272448.1 hypothetical protein [Pedobacter cryoconitis]